MAVIRDDAVDGAVYFSLKLVGRCGWWWYAFTVCDYMILSSNTPAEGGTNVVAKSGAVYVEGTSY